MFIITELKPVFEITKWSNQKLGCQNIRNSSESELKIKHSGMQKPFPSWFKCGKVLLYNESHQNPTKLEKSWSTDKNKSINQ